jgi:hypothetical protein
MLFHVDRAIDLGEFVVGTRDGCRENIWGYRVSVPDASELELVNRWHKLVIEIQMK